MVLGPGAGAGAGAGAKEPGRYKSLPTVLRPRKCVAVSDLPVIDSQPIQKFWSTFCALTILEIRVEKGGGLDPIQKFLGTFSLICGEL